MPFKKEEVILPAPSNTNLRYVIFMDLVGVRGLEPPTPRPPGECATRLRHTPTSSMNTVLITQIYPTNQIDVYKLL